MGRGAAGSSCRPGIAAVDLGRADAAIDRKQARPPGARGIPRTYAEQVVRAAAGTRRARRLQCNREGTGGRRGESPTGRAGRREGQREGRPQRPGPSSGGRGQGAVGVARALWAWPGASPGCRLALVPPAETLIVPRTYSTAAPGGGGQLSSPTSGSAAPLVSRERGRGGPGWEVARGGGGTPLFFLPGGQVRRPPWASLVAAASCWKAARSLWGPAGWWGPSHLASWAGSALSFGSSLLFLFISWPKCTWPKLSEP